MIAHWDRKMLPLQELVFPVDTMLILGHLSVLDRLYLFQFHLLLLRLAYLVLEISLIPLVPLRI